VAACGGRVAAAKTLHKTWTARGGAWQIQIYCRSLWQRVRARGGS
jgi:hypothetical protein